MPNTRRKSVRLALGAASLLLLGCAPHGGPPDPAEAEKKVLDSRTELRALVGETVQDSDRAATVQDLLDNRDRLVEEQTARVAKFKADLRALNASYDSSRQEFEQLITAYNADRRRIQGAFIEYTGDMKAATTKEEWKVIAKFEAKNLDPRTLTRASEES